MLHEKPFIINDVTCVTRMLHVCYTKKPFIINDVTRVTRKPPYFKILKKIYKYKYIPV